MVSSAPIRNGAGDFTISTSGWKPNVMLNCSAEVGGGGFGAMTGIPYTDGSGNMTTGIRGRSGTVTVDVTGVSLNCSGDRQ
jgi:hypothetical protein